MRLNQADKLKIKDLAKKHNITFDEAKDAIESQYSFIREKTSSLDFDPNLTREEFNKLKTNFNIPRIGKMYASFYLYVKMNKNNGRRTIKDD